MLRPIIADALDKTGAVSKLAMLRASGLLDRPAQDAAAAPVDRPKRPLAELPSSRDGLIDTVTDQAMRGIFKYIGRQEDKIRDDPTELAFKLLEHMDR